MHFSAATLLSIQKTKMREKNLEHSEFRKSQQKLRKGINALVAGLIFDPVLNAGI